MPKCPAPAESWLPLFRSRTPGSSGEILRLSLSSPVGGILPRLPMRESDLIAKIYQVDPLVCTRCGQRMRILAFVSDQHSIRRILDHLGLPLPEQDGPRPRGRSSASPKPARVGACRPGGTERDGTVAARWFRARLRSACNSEHCQPRRLAHPQHAPSARPQEFSSASHPPSPPATAALVRHHPRRLRIKPPTDTSYGSRSPTATVRAGAVALRVKSSPFRPSMRFPSTDGGAPRLRLRRRASGLVDAAPGDRRAGHALDW